MNTADIAAKCRAAQRRHGLGLIMVDHMQIVRADDADNRNGSTAAITGISHRMKELAKKFDCPVLLLSQLNRSLEGREDKRPGLADLRQSGAIEEDADVVGFVYRPELHLKKSPPEKKEGESEEKHASAVSAYYSHRDAIAGRAELIFEKLRDEETKSVPLRWDGPTTSFAEVETDAA